MTGLRSVVIKFAVFATVAALLLLLLVNTMVNGLTRDAREFDAIFTDVSGLRIGDDVRTAGVRVGRVSEIEVHEQGAKVGLEIVEDQPLLDNTTVVMRYQNLLGQRYLALEQPEKRGAELEPGATIPVQRTSPGFDLTALLNGFRPLFDTLKPQDVNKLATSLIRVLQGEGGTLEQLLTQTTELTNFVADRDAVIGDVLTNLTPVLENLSERGPQVTSTVRELRALMTALARDRQSIGQSIDGVSELVVSTSQLLDDARVPLVAATKEFVTVTRMLAENRERFTRALRSFSGTFEGLGRASSYENALNIYVCSLYLQGLGQSVNPVGDNGPFSEVCR